MRRFLTPWEEVVGTLRGFDPNKGLLNIDNLRLYVEDRNLTKKLRSLIGNKIGILRTDNDEYFIREIGFSK